MVDYSNIKFPAPIYPYVTKEVLVESFEVCTCIELQVENESFGNFLSNAVWYTDIRVYQESWRRLTEVPG